MIYRVGAGVSLEDISIAFPGLEGWGFLSAPDFSPAHDYCPCPEQDGAPSDQEYTPLPKATQIIVCGPA